MIWFFLFWSITYSSFFDKADFGNKIIFFAQNVLFFIIFLQSFYLLEILIGKGRKIYVVREVSTKLIKCRVRNIIISKRIFFVGRNEELVEMIQSKIVLEKRRKAALREYYFYYYAGFGKKKRIVDFYEIIVRGIIICICFVSVKLMTILFGKLLAGY